LVDAVGQTVVVKVEFHVASAAEDVWPMGVWTSEVELTSCMLMLASTETVTADVSVTTV
jgi:hypothetical protein